jgi:two-component system sensor histidine kinase HydH
MSRATLRAHALFDEQLRAVHVRGDRLFAALMLAQWLMALVFAFTISPYAWSGEQRTVHTHVYVAMFLGALVSSLPIALAVLKPGETTTRFVMAIAQVLWSAILIHLTGGRIETHFHVFGSLAFLAFYRDWRVIAIATVVVAGDHLLRGIFWSESVYGIRNPEWWRFLEHAAWVAFEDIILVLGIRQSLNEMRVGARRHAEVEELSHQLAQLAASVGHELRNPLGAIRNAAAYLSRKLSASDAKAEPKALQMLGIIEKEVEDSKRIISDLLDFARERPPHAEPCALHPLVDEAAARVEAGNVKIENEVPSELPAVNVDKDQFRQILVNLLQNGVEALRATGAAGRVTVRAEVMARAGLRLTVADNGAGMATDVSARIFEPLFTTKTKGTGLGLAIVSNVVRAHKGTIEVTSRPGEGAKFVIDLPSVVGASQA